MNFNLPRHMRLAGCVAIWVGLLLHNWIVILLGNLIMVCGYMWTIAKVESWIESQNKEEKEDASNS